MYISYPPTGLGFTIHLFSLNMIEHVKIGEKKETNCQVRVQYLFPINGYEEQVVCKDTLETVLSISRSFLLELHRHTDQGTFK